MKKMFYIWREQQLAISETYGNGTLMRVTRRFEIRCTCGQFVRSA